MNRLEDIGEWDSCMAAIALNNCKEILTPREVEVLRLRSEKRTLEQIGSRFNVTRERIRQILSRAFRKARHYSVLSEMTVLERGFVYGWTVHRGSELRVREMLKRLIEEAG